MARIRIDDLNESRELDLRAMQEVRGGARGASILQPRYNDRFRRARALLAGKRRVPR